MNVFRNGLEMDFVKMRIMFHNVIMMEVTAVAAMSGHRDALSVFARSQIFNAPPRTAERHGGAKGRRIGTSA